MKAKMKSMEECSTLFEIEVPKEDIGKALEEVYAEIQKAATVPGFRAGKAPRELVEKHYAGNAKEEALKRLVSEAYRKALEEHGVHPIGHPEITDVTFDLGKPLSFKARVETRPQFKLKNYKGLKIEKKKVALKEDDVAKTIENLRELNAKYLPADQRPVQLGDYAVCDIDCSVDGKPAHKKRENTWVAIDKDSLIPGLYEHMVGMNPGDERDIEADLPEKYPNKSLAGKRAVYHVKVKEIKTRALPALDDEFAKDLGRENLDTLKKEIAVELERRMQMNADVDAENQLLKKLTDDNNFHTPRSLFERQLKHMVEDAKNRLLDKGFKKEDLDTKEGEFQKKFQEDAKRQVRLFFILDEISKAEKIDVSADDVADAYTSIAAQTNQPEEEVKKHYESEDLVGDLEEKLRESKTIDFLMKQASITEVE